MPQEVLGGRQPHLLLGFGDVPEEIEEGSALPQHPAGVRDTPLAATRRPLRHAATTRGAATTAAPCPLLLFRGSGDGAGSAPSLAPHRGCPRAVSVPTRGLSPHRGCPRTRPPPPPPQPRAPLSAIFPSPPVPPEPPGGDRGAVRGHTRG